MEVCVSLLSAAAADEDDPDRTMKIMMSVCPSRLIEGQFRLSLKLHRPAESELIKDNERVSVSSNRLSDDLFFCSD